jgi:hypothetical protein
MIDFAVYRTNLRLAWVVGLAAGLLAGAVLGWTVAREKRDPPGLEVAPGVRRIYDRAADAWCWLPDRGGIACLPAGTRGAR